MVVVKKILPYLVLLIACIAALQWSLAQQWWQTAQLWLYQPLIGFVLAINLLLRRLIPLLGLAVILLFTGFAPAQAPAGVIAMSLCLVILMLMPERGFLQLKNGLWLCLLALGPLAVYFQTELSTQLSTLVTIAPKLWMQLYYVGLGSLVLIAVYRLYRDGSTVTAGLLCLLLWCIGNFYWPSTHPVLEPALALCLMLSLLDYRHLAYLDDLTGLPSRRACNEALSRLGKNTYLIMLDVDHFKKVNDGYGHDVGDQVLKMLAKQLQKLKYGGSAFRFGGEEFCLIFPKSTSPVIDAYLNQLREQIADYQLQLREQRTGKQSRKSTSKAKKASLSITVSMGVARYDQPQDNFEKVLKRADQALYKAKKQGRNKVVFDTAIND